MLSSSSSSNLKKKQKKTCFLLIFFLNYDADDFGHYLFIHRIDVHIFLLLIESTDLVEWK